MGDRRMFSMQETTADRPETTAEPVLWSEIVGHSYLWNDW
jgi:hypothetical protein